MNVNLLMEQGITKIMKTAGHFYLNNPAGRAFSAKAVPALKKSARKRELHEEQGLHIPAFLIASITSRCNLYCSGCYARAGGGCGESVNHRDLDVAQWRSIFAQADNLGVSFILFAGGEPLLRRDVLELAAEFPQMIFPVFTNGTMLEGDILAFLDRHRNLIPVFSIEGDEGQTDSRRGPGTYGRILVAMESLRQRRILFGAAITVTGINLEQVTDGFFLDLLDKKGCGLALYVEYVPVEEGTGHLVLNEHQQHALRQQCDSLKKRFDRMIILSFPGDEQAMGGCLASGRGFFHINAHGGAEPCPFSPHAKHNLLETSMADVLRSEYFVDLRALAANAGHYGGCTLFHQKTSVERLISR